ncbi:hypothetical protein [Propionibacterium cyclohexanicum]|uniref:hypothetical protein n=1 Tax=Propionibacterium cyclohexanicum TaxID=64702 RepID=UPI00115FDE52|nr:hypothetical protein [Propionibacterium cyclohexanicum]
MNELRGITPRGNDVREPGHRDEWEAAQKVHHACLNALDIIVDYSLMFHTYWDLDAIDSHAIILSLEQKTIRATLRQKSDYSRRGPEEWSAFVFRPCQITRVADIDLDPNRARASRQTAVAAGAVVLAVATVVATASILGSGADVGIGAGEVALGKLGADLAEDEEVASSAAQAARLAEEFGTHEVMGEESVGRAIAGNGSRRTIDDIDRLTNVFGGDEEDWSTMSSESHNFSGRGSIQAHWYENVETGCRYDARIKTGNQYK